jgi:hypothetical protein
MQFQSTALTTLALLTSALAAPSSLKARDDAWAIRNFSRDCTDPNICTYSLTIDTGAGTQQCIVVDTDSPATTAPFYNYACQEVCSLPFAPFLRYFFVVKFRRDIYLRSDLDENNRMQTTTSPGAGTTTMTSLS